MDATRSPLDAVHRALGARIVPFGGWDMPLQYATGTLAEHEACRRDAVVFDVSHLGTVRVTGAGAKAVLQWAFTNDLDKIEPGRAQYTHLLDPDDASVLDDIIVWWRDDDLFDVMPNASNTDRVTDAIAEAVDVVDAGSVDARGVTDERAVLAVQGPNARRRLADVSAAAAAIGRFRVGAFEWGGAEGVVAGTGYTGEDGVECAVPVAVAEDFWTAVTDAGIVPAGLGARDTLRLEAGLPLLGHELGAGSTTLQARLGWVIGWDKGDFRGREPLELERAAGVDPHLVGLTVEGRRPPRQGQAVLQDGVPIGAVSSGNFSPHLGHGIALAFVPPAIETGSTVTIDVRGTELPATVVDPPFVG